jgi:hypothetical protein
VLLAELSLMLVYPKLFRSVQDGPHLLNILWF